MTVAGHTFDARGICTGLRPNSQDVCGRRWIDIRNTTADEVGQPDIAHHANLTATEYAEIEVKRAAEDERFARALSDVATT